jgi:hypothetical protein
MISWGRHACLLCSLGLLLLLLHCDNAVCQQHGYMVATKVFVATYVAEYVEGCTVM